MKKTINLILVAILVLVDVSCSIARLQQQGSVKPQDFHSETKFTTVKSVIVLPVLINGVSKNFLFDTGGQISLIQRDTATGKTMRVDGASNRTVKLGLEIVKSIQIAELDFQNTYAGSSDLVGLKEQIPNFGGIIGEPIISKANWLIDYPNKKLEISNNNLADSTFMTIKIERKSGTPYTFIKINGKQYKAMIDLGSSTALSIPAESMLAREIMKKYAFKENERELYTIGGLRKEKEKITVMPVVELGNHEITNVETAIKRTSKLRIGNLFFKDHIIYIDNIDHIYKIKKAL
jgi:hypothetical protein